jgi:hypothetical protein
MCRVAFPFCSGRGSTVSNYGVKEGGVYAADRCWVLRWYEQAGKQFE